MPITFDTAKRDRAWRERGLAFEDAAGVLDGRQLTLPDEREDYGESRFVTFGRLSERVVAVVWTPRGADRRVISMRHANERERRFFARALDGPG